MKSISHLKRLQVPPLEDEVFVVSTHVDFLLHLNATGRCILEALLDSSVTDGLCDKFGRSPLHPNDPAKFISTLSSPPRYRLKHSEVKDLFPNNYKLL